MKATEDSSKLKDSFNIDESDKRTRNGMYISKSLALIIIVFLMVIIFIVGLLAGLLGKRSSTETYYYVPEAISTSSNLNVSVTTVAPQTTPDSFGNGPWQDIRLQTEIKPISYKLSFSNINTNLGTYTGKTTIKFDLKASLKHIMFHIKYLTINAQSIRLLHIVDNAVVPISRQFEYVRNQYYVLESSTLFKDGEYELEVTYTGSTTIGIVGMYQSTYQEDGQSK